jgi:glucosyl-3-phosphoglycerate synthase
MLSLVASTEVMSDFHQSGPVTALPRLFVRPVEELERAIERFTPRFPVTLVIPILPEEMDRPALSGILEELTQVRYLDTLLVSLNRASADDFSRTQRFFARYPGRVVVLWNESPSIERLMNDFERAGLNIGEPGKGRACWLAIGYVIAEGRAEYIAFHDGDVVGYKREMLARLVLPAVDPTVDFDFVKGYYARVTDRLHGRLTRLMLTPLLAALTRLVGDHQYLRYLASFRYALSGEIAVQTDLAMRMRLPPDWGLEIVSLFEALRHRAAYRICQVELCESYEHKHRALSAGDSRHGLHRMARDVVKHLLRTLAAAGVVLSEGVLWSVLSAYQREAEDAVADSYCVSVLNGLQYDRHEEEQIVHTFTRALRASVEEFLADPLGPPLVPNWARVWSGFPEAATRLLEAVSLGER